MQLVAVMHSLESGIGLWLALSLAHTLVICREVGLEGRTSRAICWVSVKSSPSSRDVFDLLHGALWSSNGAANWPKIYKYSVAIAALEDPVTKKVDSLVIHA